MLSLVAEAVLTGSPLPEGGDWGPYTTRTNELSLHEGCLLWGARVIVPKSLQSQVLKLLHAGHPGIEKSKMIARSHVWWPGIDNDMTNQVRSCPVCQAHQKSARRIPIMPWPFPDKPWSRIHVDSGGPFMGHYFLRDGGCFFQMGGRSPCSITICRGHNLCVQDCLAQHGLPDVIVSDIGPAFTSIQYADFLNRNGIRPHAGALLINPASNRAAERVVQTIKDN
ncbi:uncharacterized protein K02A2.6-like [Rhipicephalus sanguineus]|uniref:uncharacterized protein K02A2.6-like n=1 Tax=Rhipicephalus sanguineus TaxID=34632 RepID=UPI00189316FF|nr:uncharacterized protein K02A2.6-like [Rhipicephalus sanguineus]